MNRLFWLLSLGVVPFLLGCSGKTQEEHGRVSAISSGRADEWHEVNSLEGDFKARFPDAPFYKQNQSPSPTGGLARVQMYNSMVGLREYMVGWIDYPDPKYEHDLLQNLHNTITARGGTVLKRENIFFQGYPGIEYVATEENRNYTGKLVGKSIYIRNQELNRFYTIGVMGPDVEESDRRVTAFLSSFQITLQRK